MPQINAQIPDDTYQALKAVAVAEYGGDLKHYTTEALRLVAQHGLPGPRAGSA